MKETYLFEYVNENEFKKLERAIKKYNMLAYKKLYFDFYPALKEGNFLGDIVAKNPDNTISYVLKLPTDVMFSKVHGDILLYYIVDEKNKTVLLDKFEPFEILSEGHATELVTYKGVMVSKKHSDKDMFKINLLNMINK